MQVLTGRSLTLLALLAAVVAIGLALRSDRDDPRVVDEVTPVWIVDGSIALQHPEIGEAIAAAGGRVMVYDFPGADLPNGRRYSWARDYGPLAMPVAASGWAVWDALTGGRITPTLENEALVQLAQVLGADYRRLDLEIQGGNWLLLPDTRVITTTRFLAANPQRTRAEVEALLQAEGVAGIIEIEPLPGELTGHADMVLNVHPQTGEVFVGSLAQAAIELIPDEPAATQYRQIAIAIRESLDRTAAQLQAELGEERVFRLPQPLPYLDPHPDGERYRPDFPSFVNGVFVSDAAGRVTYIYGIARNEAGETFYSFDLALLDDYVAQMDRVAAERGFVARGIEVGDLITHGGSVHCATVEAYLDAPSP